MPSPTFPKTQGGYISRYPITRLITFHTDVAKFLNDAEQRSKMRRRLEKFRLALRRIKHADLVTIENFFIDRQGAGTANFDIEVAGTVYHDCGFTNDTMQVEDAPPGPYYTVTFDIVQVMRDFAKYPHVSAPPGAFPTFPRGSLMVRAQEPFARSISFLTASVAMESGFRWAKSLRQEPIKTWTLGFPVLDDVDLALIENHFIAAQGNWYTFAFTDPHEPTVAPYTARYGNEELEIQYTGLNEYSTTLNIAEVR